MTHLHCLRAWVDAEQAAEGKAEARRRREHDELWGSDPDCRGNVVSASGGGVRCTSCSGWFCY